MTNTNKHRLELTQDVAELAEDVVVMTPDEARAMPGFLGRVVAPMLARHEYYTCTVNGLRTLFIARESK